ncbi:hypothetical protein E2I00_010897 [Balaenoptera physalus]|uniref:VWFA domain-containing protein n=1 Tax=Balaenoptera physalus TaxID=9770 RepID=A0A643C5V5_BALPH|nr:hypothetical protein E2I00_010897 [Balaenoptera physalus]
MRGLLCSLLPMLLLLLQPWETQLQFAVFESSAERLPARNLLTPRGYGARHPRSRKDLCAEGGHGCQHQCVSSPGTFHCACNPGYRLAADDKSCLALDLCTEGTHGCEHHCVSSPGFYFCRCRAGFVLQQDQRSCRGERTPRLAPGPRSLMAPPLTTAALGTTAASMSVLAPLVGHGAAAEGATTCCPTAGAVRDLCNGVDHGCEFQCVSEGFSYRCLCPERWQLQADGKSCSRELWAQGARPRALNVPRVGLVFTDGRSQDDVSVWAARAKEEGIVMYAVGVGKAVEEELREIASEPAELHVSYSPDFSTMTHLLENLKGSICPGGHQRGDRASEPLRVRKSCGVPGPHAGGARESVAESYPLGPGARAGGEKGPPATPGGFLNRSLAQLTARLEDLENQLATQK